MKKRILIPFIISSIILMIAILLPKCFENTPITTNPNNLLIDLGKGVKLEMVKMYFRTFQMGSPDSEPYRRENEGPVHTVTLTKDFYMGKYEVTQAQWKLIMGTNPSEFKSGDNYPVDTVSWDDISMATTGFLAKINAKKLGKGTFRLPTEAEWEYSCRAGTDTMFYWGDNIDSNYLWYNENSSNTTHQVGTKLPNAFGLYDMSGNVFEFCSDICCVYQSDNEKNLPLAPIYYSDRVLRGGSWDYGAPYCRSAIRYHVNPSYRYGNIGFRLVFSPDQ